VLIEERVVICLPVERAKIFEQPWKGLFRGGRFNDTEVEVDGRALRVVSMPESRTSFLHKVQTPVAAIIDFRGQWGNISRIISLSSPGIVRGW
jgi:hypothetical protein